MSIITEKKPLLIQIPGEKAPNELPISASAVGYDFVQGQYIYYSTGSDSWVTAPPNGGGGGGGSGNEYWFSSGSNSIATTGSVAIVGADYPTKDKASDYGSDVFFFVSGNIGTDNIAEGKTVFGGNVYTSGSFVGNTGSSVLSVRIPGDPDNAGVVTVYDATTFNLGPALVVFGDGSRTDGFGFVDKGGLRALITGSNQGFFSGSYTFPQGITGSLTKLTDGTDYLIAGANISLSTGSNGAVTISSTGGGSGLATGKQYIAAKTTTTNTNSLMIGQFSWVPADYTSLTSVKVRAIMSTDGTANHTGSLQIYNLTSGSYVDLIDTPATSKYLKVTGSTPTLVTSSNLLATVTNFDDKYTAIYEVRVSGSTANNIVIGGVELIFS